MDWRRKRQIRNLVDGILEQNVLHRPPIELIPASQFFGSSAPFAQEAVLAGF